MSLSISRQNTHYILIVMIISDPYFIPIILFALAGILATLCLQLDPRDKRDSSFYGLMLASFLFVVGFWKVVQLLRGSW